MIRTLVSLFLTIALACPLHAQQPTPCQQLAMQHASLVQQISDAGAIYDRLRVETALLYTTIQIEDGVVIPLTAGDIITRIGQLMMENPPQTEMAAAYMTLLGMLGIQNVTATQLAWLQWCLSSNEAQQLAAGC